MTKILEAIREELGILFARIERLQQAEALLSAPEAVKPEITKAAKDRGAETHTTKIARPRSGGVNPSSADVHAYVISHPPSTRAEIAAALGSKPRVLDKQLARLLAAGKIGVEGLRGSYRYHAPNATKPALAQLADARRRPPAGTTPERGMDPLLDAILELESATTKQLVNRTGMPAGRVMERGRELVRRGLVNFTDVEGVRVWLPRRSETDRDVA